MIQAISRVTLTQSILDEMLKLIKDGAWEPGGKIPSETSSPPVQGREPSLRRTR